MGDNDPSARGPSLGRFTWHRLMPRHAHFYVGLATGVIAFAVSLFLTPGFALVIGANALFVAYLVLAFLKLPFLSSEYLRRHAQEEDAPSGGIFAVVALVVTASIVSLFITLNDGDPDVIKVILSVCSVLLGWFTVQVIGAFHYAYEYYQVPEASEQGSEDIVGGLQFPGDEDPDGTAFMYFSFTVGTSVATSDTKISSNAMRRRLTYHLVFSHLYNTIILAAAVNVVMG